MNLLELGIYLLYQNFYKRICVILYDSYSNDSGGLSGFNSGFIRILPKIWHEIAKCNSPGVTTLYKTFENFYKKLWHYEAAPLAAPV